MRYLGVIAAASVTMLSMPVMAADSYSLNNPPIVETEEGELRGLMDDGTFEFLGVPYAQAERFEAPQKLEKWEGVKNAQSYGAVCPIQDQTEVGADELVWPHRYWVQNENCLNLNVWTQSIDKEAKKPVVVFFHGGGFKNGSSIEGAAQDGKNLSEYGDVVVVTVNHRLNVLGFMDLSDYGDEYADTANLGIQDLVASLEWVQENIENFGGDASNVTIFGQSGGGGKVNTLLNTPSAEGLFSKAAVISGSKIIVDKETNDAVVDTTLEKLGLEKDQIGELKDMDYYTLINAAQEACTDLGTDWRPVADGEIVQEEMCDWANDIPYLASTTFSEFNYTWKFDGANKNEWTDEETMAHLTEKYGDEYADKIATEFQKVFPDRPLADAYFYDGANYRPRVSALMDEKLETARAACYEYLFAYEAPVNGGVLPYHCNDLIYLFHNVDIPVVSVAVGGADNETTQKLQDTVADAFVAFAKTGNPSTETLEWKPYTNDEKNVMVFDKTSECKVLGDEQLCALMQEASATK